MKYSIERGLALLTAFSVLLFSAVGCSADKQTEKDPAKQTESDALVEQAVSLLQTHGSEEGKEETVYIVADASGTAEETIVSAWLKNPEEKDTINDVTDLKDIHNTKGEETFTRSNDSVVWDAAGADIHYQGSTDKDLPITTTISYELDGQTVQPERLNGASGHLVMRFQYENHTAAERKVGAKTVTMYQPFLVVSGALLNNEKAGNITVTNGKTISDRRGGYRFAGAQRKFGTSGSQGQKREKDRCRCTGGSGHRGGCAGFLSADDGHGL